MCLTFFSFFILFTKGKLSGMFVDFPTAFGRYTKEGNKSFPYLVCIYFQRINKRRIKRKSFSRRSKIPDFIVHTYNKIRRVLKLHIKNIFYYFSSISLLFSSSCFFSFFCLYFFLLLSFSFCKIFLLFLIVFLFLKFLFGRFCCCYCWCY